MQHVMDARKRLKGAPVSGMVSIAVTDIEGFSELMKHDQELTTKALMLHNSLIRNAKWSNIGSTISQEGDSYTIIFHEAADAVKFCLQVWEDGGVGDVGDA